jgi:hypothetical protein
LLSQPQQTIPLNTLHGSLDPFDCSVCLQAVSWAEPRAFTRLLVTPKMFENHLPNEYLAGLRAWLAAAIK